MSIDAYPLCWPAGWPRTKPPRQRAKFNRRERQYRDGGSWIRHFDLTVLDAVTRCLKELELLGAKRDDIVISTNVQTRFDGLPRSDSANPTDPGAAVYWKTRKDKAPKVMAIDIYDRVADNLAAIAATLEAMRAIDRHGGAQILERAFTGFQALPAPIASRHWRQVFGFDNGTPSADDLTLAYRRARSATHSDKEGGDDDAFIEVERAYADACAELGL